MVIFFVHKLHFRRETCRLFCWRNHEYHLLTASVS